MIDILIAGAGTAGLSAAIYGVRAGKSVLLLESSVYGGQIVSSPEVENYPGIQNITGYDFASDLYEQANSLGAKIEFAKITGFSRNNETFTVFTTQKKYPCQSLIVATGAKNRALGLSGEEHLVGKGISYCATCDGAFFKGKAVAVNGGGNTALEDAIFLSQYCSHVTIIHRRDNFRGENQLLETLKRKDNVSFILSSNITKFIYNHKLTAIEITHCDTGAVQTLAVDGLFIAIGQIPQNQPFSPPLALDKNGYIIAGEDCVTNVPGVFAAGDCRTKKVRQLATAAADGAVAGLTACEYIDHKNKK